MRVRVPLIRVVQQFTDVIVDGVATTDEAVDRVTQQLTTELPRARLLKGVQWHELGVQDLYVTEGAVEDKGV